MPAPRATQIQYAESPGSEGSPPSASNALVETPSRIVVARERDRARAATAGGVPSLTLEKQRSNG